MTVDAWYNHWITEIKAKTVRWSTLSSYKRRYNNNIKEIIGSMVISDVKPMHCQNVLNVLDNNGYVGASMVQTKAVLSVIFSDACENGLISVNPVTKSVKCPKKPEKNTSVLTLEEQEKFLAAAKESIYYSNFLFVLQTGVRTSELKTSSGQRDIPMTQTVYDLLADMKCKQVCYFYVLTKQICVSIIKTII